MRWRLLTVFAAGSMVVCIGLVVLWVRSAFVLDLVERSCWDASRQRRVDLAVCSARGSLSSWVQVWQFRPQAEQSATRDAEPDEQQGWRHRKQAIRTPAAGSSLLAFRFQRTHASPALADTGVVVDVTLVEVPFWLPVLLTAAPPVAWTGLILRRRRRTMGLCPQCGYDLRASEVRCPECGQTIVAPSRPIENPQSAIHNPQ